MSEGESSYEQHSEVGEERKTMEPERTLEDDALLLERLMALSASIQSRTKAVDETIGSLAKEAREAEVGAKNAFNGFLMLCNTQFIENRVYEEDHDAEEKVDERAGPSEVSEETVRGRWSSALSLGLVALQQKVFFDDAGEPLPTAT